MTPYFVPFASPLQVMFALGASMIRPALPEAGEVLDDRDARRHDPADRRVQDVLVLGAARTIVGAGLRHRHVDGLEQRTRRVDGVLAGRDPVEPADVPAEIAEAIVVEDLDGPQAHTRRDADDTTIAVPPISSASAAKRA